MRKFECDEKACVLEPSQQNQLGSRSVKTYDEMSGGSSGLDPAESTYNIPLKQEAATGVKRSVGKRKKRAEFVKGLKGASKRRRSAIRELKLQGEGSSKLELDEKRESVSRGNENEF